MLEDKSIIDGAKRACEEKDFELRKCAVPFDVEKACRCENPKSRREEESIAPALDEVGGKNVPRSPCVVRGEGVFSEEQLRKLVRTEVQEAIGFQFTMLREQLEFGFASLQENVDRELDKDRQLQKKEELFQNVYADLKKYQAGLERGILSPFLKAAIKWYERIQEMVRYYAGKTPVFGRRRRVYCALLREYKNLGAYILDTLENFDVEIIRTEEGDLFDRRFCCVLETVETRDESMANKIVKCFTPGFCYSDGKIIQYAEVAVYKFVGEEV